MLMVVKLIISYIFANSIIINYFFRYPLVIILLSA